MKRIQALALVGGLLLVGWFLGRMEEPAAFGDEKEDCCRYFVEYDQSLHTALLFRRDGDRLAFLGRCRGDEYAWEGASGGGGLTFGEGGGEDEEEEGSGTTATGDRPVFGSPSELTRELYRVLNQNDRLRAGNLLLSRSEFDRLKSELPELPDTHATYLEEFRTRVDTMHQRMKKLAVYSKHLPGELSTNGDRQWMTDAGFMYERDGNFHRVRINRIVKLGGSWRIAVFR